MWGRTPKPAGTGQTAQDKLSRRAVDDIEYEEITDVFELLHEKVKVEADRTSRAVDEVRTVAERLVAKPSNG